MSRRPSSATKLNAKVEAGLLELLEQLQGLQPFASRHQITVACLRAGAQLLHAEPDRIPEFSTPLAG